MEKLHFSININAPKEKVWETLLEDEPIGSGPKYLHPALIMREAGKREAKSVFWLLTRRATRAVC